MVSQPFILTVPTYPLGIVQSAFIMEDILKGVAGLTVKSSKDWTPEEQIEYKTKIKSSGDKTLVFDPEKDGSFKDWAGFRPSQIGRDEGIKAVRVNRRGLKEEDVNTEVDVTKLEKVTKEFDEQRAKGDYAITKQFLVDLGLKHGLTIGNYLIYL